jgi:hypothetical protein
LLKHGYSFPPDLKGKKGAYKCNHVLEAG